MCSPISHISKGERQWLLAMGQLVSFSGVADIGGGRGGGMGLSGGGTKQAEAYELGVADFCVGVDEPHILFLCSSPSSSSSTCSVYTPVSGRYSTPLKCSTSATASLNAANKEGAQLTSGNASDKGGLQLSSNRVLLTRIQHLYPVHGSDQSRSHTLHPSSSKNTRTHVNSLPLTHSRSEACDDSLDYNIRCLSDGLDEVA